jgi:hypothetical protein
MANAERQINEVLALKAEFPSLELATPMLFERLQECVASERAPKAAAKRLCYTIELADATPALAGLRLRVTLPAAYPDGALCSLSVESAGSEGGAGGGAGAGGWGGGAGAAESGTSAEATAACAAQIVAYAASFEGNECVALAMEYAAEQGVALLQGSGGGGAEAVPGVQCWSLRFNHLLKGPEHKKEKAMLDAAKQGRLQGAIMWGTPGVVVLTACTEAEAKEYQSECRTIGKKGDGPNELRFPEAGLEAAGVGGLAQQKRGGKLAELDTAGMRAAVGSDEGLLKRVLGIV